MEKWSDGVERKREYDREHEHKVIPEPYPSNITKEFEKKYGGGGLLDWDAPRWKEILVKIAVGIIPAFLIGGCIYIFICCIVYAIWGIELPWPSWLGVGGKPLDVPP